MTIRILLLYTSHDGQTEKIIYTVGKQLSESGLSCEIQYTNLSKDSVPDLNRFHAVMIGTSIRYGFYHKQIRKFIQKHADYLNSKPSAFFGVNLIARKPEKQAPETNVYTRRFLQSIAWQPKLSAVFAGALKYPCYQWYDRIMIQMIMRMTKGEVDATKMVEYTDWEQVSEFTRQFIALLRNSGNK